MLNAVLYENIRRRLVHDDHVTFSILRYHRDGHVVYAGAHEDMILWRRRTSSIETLRTPGTWLGAVRDIGHATVDSEIRLEDGDLLVLYTDGVTEAMNAAGEQFGLERLGAVVASRPEEPPAAVRDRVLDATRAWMASQADDITVVVLRYHAGESA
jgi:sigma-B regulation protein RsbU (phosphoserine phosphatase)